MKTPCPSKTSKAARLTLQYCSNLLLCIPEPNFPGVMNLIVLCDLRLVSRVDSGINIPTFRMLYICVRTSHRPFFGQFFSRDTSFFGDILVGVGTHPVSPGDSGNDT